MGPYSSLRAWQLAHQLATDVARVTARFPAHERFELASQLRRAALSAPTNLVEGSARYGSGEYARFVRIAIASLAEVEYLLYFAHEMQFLSAADYHRLDELRRHANALMVRLARRLDASPR
jgi:four helix bundle protein